MSTPAPSFPPTQPIPFDPPSPTQPTANGHVPEPGLDLTPTDPDAPRAYEDIPNTPLSAALLAFILGGACMLGGVVVLFPGRYWFARRELGFYLSAWATFHFAEFAITAHWNRSRVTVDSYLLNNGIHYHVAHLCGIFEFLVRTFFFGPPKSFEWIVLSRFGMLITLLAQLLRSTAMIHASSNFTHNVVTYRRSESHRLVTSGVYGWMRHPSYAAFFYWAMGTQLVLLNPITSVGFFFVLRRFFKLRIGVEERALVRFFGRAYEEYRKRVRSGLPFKV